MVILLEFVGVVHHQTGRKASVRTAPEIDAEAALVRESLRCSDGLVGCAGAEEADGAVPLPAFDQPHLVQAAGHADAHMIVTTHVNGDYVLLRVGLEQLNHGVCTVGLDLEPAGNPVHVEAAGNGDAARSGEGRLLFDVRDPALPLRVSEHWNGYEQKTESERDIAEPRRARPSSRVLALRPPPVLLIVKALVLRLEPWATAGRAGRTILVAGVLQLELFAAVLADPTGAAERNAVVQLDATFAIVPRRTLERRKAAPFAIAVLHVGTIIKRHEPPRSA
ncbi:hypothetical protein NOVOSPHI9U_370090 [Novosphingobium sp. 9U]|nr:hypothetical protein NOVOSPHI9U_370090 [Novosphingobium sp. 9U]